MNNAIETDFFDQDPVQLAVSLLGKVLRRKICWQNTTHWLAARIVETEAYYLSDKSSHSSLGYTEKRKAMFMPPGTIYMYYARGNDSLNFSARGEGNAVLVKAAHPYFDTISSDEQIEIMRSLNPGKRGPRSIGNLCRGQTLLCRSLALKVTDWDRQTLDRSRFYLIETGYKMTNYIRCTRLGIPTGRDEHLLYRFIDYDCAHQSTSNPLTKRNWQIGKEYEINAVDSAFSK